MIDVNIKDFQNNVLKYVENTMTKDQPLRVKTNETSFVVLDESYYKQLCNSSLDKLSPEQLEDLEDEVLLDMAQERLANSDPSTWISFDDVIAKYGYTHEDLDDWTELDEEDLE